MLPTNFLYQINDIEKVIAVEKITVYGLLLLIIIGLCYHIASLNKKYDKTKTSLLEELREERKKRDEQQAKHEEDLKEILTGYHTITTRISDMLKIDK